MKLAPTAPSAAHRFLLGSMLACAACEGGTASPPRDSAISAQPEAAVTNTDFAECALASDCDWGEIDHEITSKKDCVCLYGCPYLPLNKATVTRRAAQHRRLCNPRTDGAGNDCGVDDCSAPGAITCEATTCKAAP